MAQKYYNVAQTAEILGISEDAVKQMQSNRELHGYRDGADWKFKVEDIDQLAAKRADGPAESDQPDVLLSELELGESDPGASGTVIGMQSSDQLSAESDLNLGGNLGDSDLSLDADDLSIADEDLKLDDDLKLADDDLQAAETDLSLGDSSLGLGDSGLSLGDSGLSLGDSDLSLTGDAGSSDAASQSGQFENLDSELDLTLDDDVTLEDDLAVEEGPAEVAGDNSDLALGSGQFEDDDLVLGGAGGASGSDISIGGDSGISLIDPADSGLSLEEPLELVNSDESLELGEDEVFSLSDEEEAAPAAQTPAAEEDDFLLTPLDDAGDEDDSESGSQVIALDVEGEVDEGATMVAGADGAGMAAMLEEDLGAASGAADFGAPVDAAGAVPLGAQPAGLAAGQPAAAAPAAAAVAEVPYSIWNVLSLAMCALFLTLTGMMMYDLMRNMWSWNSAYEVNSTIMDTILGLLG